MRRSALKCGDGIGDSQYFGDLLGNDYQAYFALIPDQTACPESFFVSLSPALASNRSNIPCRSHLQVTKNEPGAVLNTVLTGEASSILMPQQRAACKSISEWLLVEDGFTLTREREIESIFTIGNGKTGTRGSLEEGSQLSCPATFVAGVFTTPTSPGAVPELLKFPNWTGMKMFVNGSALNVEECELLEHRRTLDLRQATLCRDLRTRDSRGRITRFTSLRAASLADRRLLFQQVVVTAENYCLQLDVETTFELGPVIQRASVPGWKVEKDPKYPNVVPLAAVLPDGKAAAAFCVATCMMPLKDHGERQVEITDKRITERLRIEAGAGARCELHRFVSVINGQNDDARDPMQAGVTHSKAAIAAGIEAALAAHKAEWRVRWSDADIRIEGDAALERALRFASYHLISAANPEDDHVSIGARALSGHAYKGHVFWDTETYMLPFFVLTHPESADALLRYRYHSLQLSKRRVPLDTAVQCTHGSRPTQVRRSRQGLSSHPRGRCSMSLIERWKFILPPILPTLSGNTGTQLEMRSFC